MSLANGQFRIWLLLLSLLLGGHSLSQGPNDSAGDGLDMARLVLISNPDSASVTINDSLSPKTTPLTLMLTPGAYRLGATKEGHESLTYKLDLMAGQRLSAQFILKSFPPPPIPADSLGLLYLPEKIQIDVKEAERTGQTFKRLAETFAIIPLVHGILARLIVDKNDRSQADILIVSGAILSGGSLILGKILSDRKRRNIENENARIAEENKIISEHNHNVDQEVKKKNEEALQIWFLENENRGRVIIDELPP